MQPKDLIQEFAKIGLPLIGAALPIPGGAAIGTALAAAIGSPSSKAEDILSTIGASAEAAAKAQQFQLTHQETILKITVDAEVAQVDSVNKTLQTEAMGGSFWQRNHHAYESSAVVVFVICVYFVLPLLKIKVPDIPEFAYVMLGAILGVTAWQRGAANVATAKSNGT